MWLTVPWTLRQAVRLPPPPLALLGLCSTMRVVRWHLARAPFDAVISTMNEIDVGRPAIQYVHYPWAKYPRPGVDYRWYHYTPAVRLYRWLANQVAGYRESRATANYTLANSSWTAALFEEWYGRSCRVLYPPVVGGFPDVPRAMRARAFIVVGRISPEKELEKVIQIVAGASEHRP